MFNEQPTLKWREGGREECRKESRFVCHSVQTSETCREWNLIVGPTYIGSEWRKFNLLCYVI